MSKQDDIFNYLNENKIKSDVALINDIKEKFNVSEVSAPIYYSRWKSYLKDKGLYKEVRIILRPLDMDKSNLDVTLMKELVKCVEEDQEFSKGALSNNIDNTIEEFWDSVQTKLNVMSIMGIPTDMIYKDLDKHIKKMNKRGYVFKEN